MTDHYELVGHIRKALTEISDFYDRSLDGPREAGSIGGGNATKEAPAPVPLHTLDVRADAKGSLRYWVGFIHDEVRDHNKETSTTVIDGDNIPAMCEHINRWTDILAGQWPDEAADLLKEARKNGNALHRLALPERRDWIPIGACPVTVADADGNSVACGAQVRAYDRTELDDTWTSGTDTITERKVKRIQFIECPGCGTNDTLSWWMSQILPEGSDKATASQVITFVAVRGDVVLSHDQIRKWKSLGHIQGHGQDVKGRTLYSCGAVLAYAKDKTKEAVA